MDEQKPNENPQPAPKIEQKPETKAQQTQLQPQRLSNAQRRERRKSFFGKIASIAILIFMVGWVFAAYYGITNEGDQTNQDEISVKDISGTDYKFYILTDGTFGTYINIGNEKVPVAFRMDPRNASLINLEESAVQQILSAKKLYITFNPNGIEDEGRMAVATAELSRITSLYGIETVGAYTKDSNPPNPSIPIRTCDDSRDLTTVIEMGVSNTTAPGITNDRGCINVFAETPDALIDAADKLGMNLLGIKL
ncbi:MAG: hypothetical protein V1839_01080 [archaeon]